MRKRNSMARLLALARPYVWPLFFAFLCLVAANGAELIKPYIFKVVIDDYIVGGRQGQGLMTIPGLSIAYFVTVVIGALMTILQIKWMNRVGQDIIRDLRARVFSHIQHMPLSVLDTYSSGRLVTRGTNDVEALSEFFTDVMLGLLKDAILLVGIMAVMLAMEWRLALVSFAILPLIVAIVWSMRRLLRPMHARIKHLTGRINGFIAETLSGLRVVQSFNHQKELLGRFQALNDDYNQASKLRVTLNSINRPIIDVVNTLAVALVLWYGMGRVLNATLPIGLLYAFTTYIKQFFEPIMDFAEKYDTIQSAETSADRIFELLDQEEALEAAIPEYCPEVTRIVDAVGQLCLREYTSRQISGSVLVTVLYTSEESPGLRSLTLPVPFLTQADDKRLTGCDTVCMAGRLLLTEARAVTGRKLYLRVMPELTLTGYTCRRHRICTGVGEEPTLRLHRQEQSLTLLTSVTQRQSSVTQELQPQDWGEPPEELLAQRICPRITGSQPVGSRLLAKGEARICLLYRTQDGSLHTWEDTLPFSCLLDGLTVPEEAH